MTRLDVELTRLFLMPAGQLAADGRSRTLVLGLAAPVDWPALGGLWRAVQAELGWPAPAITVDGEGAMQLWFALAEPVPLAQGHAVAAALARRFLPAVPAGRLRLWPGAAHAHAHSQEQAQAPAPALPPRSTGEDRWSAFVSPDLAPLFTDTPWLDIAPGEEGQAHLLSQCQPIGASAYRDGLAMLDTVGPAGAEPVPADAPGPLVLPVPPGPDSHAHTIARDFLLRVVQDDTAPLALRVQAAQALLQADTAPRG